MPVEQEADMRVVSGKNFCAVEVGEFAQLGNYKLEVPALKRSVNGKLFLKQFAGFTGMQMSMTKLPPGVSVPFYHAHKQNEEAYIFTGGKGQMQIDGEVFDVAEGTVVRVSPKGYRVVRNNSDADLYYICVQAKDGSLEQETMEDGIRSDDPVNWPS
ncbi:MAG TPA: cupin domain-containing protein [Drouetiella sp.]|jgi:mannose-6-phosphate isomerase-like protein (cupin superfamily)